MRSLRRRWPDGRVIYKFDDTLHKSTKKNILIAMKNWSDKTCLTFTPAADCTEGCLLFFSGGNGCWSNSIGYARFENRPQRIHLQQPGCTSPITIMHEIGHAIGLWHEQSRPDRDHYVTIEFKNIKKGKAHNFRKRTWNEVDTEGLEYDYASIMQYRQKAFSKNGDDTILIADHWLYAIEGMPILGKAKELSYGDYTVINRLYDCPH